MKKLILVLFLFCIPIQVFAEEKPQAIFHVSTNKKLIALTFDDGPDPLYTPKIITILNENEAKGTFFAVGYRIEKYPELSKSIVQNGNELANHTFYHPDFRGKSTSFIENEINKADEMIFQTTNKRPLLFRPPLGFYNNTILSLVEEKGYHLVMWSRNQDTFDWQNPGVQKIVSRVLDNVKPGNIILFHDHGSGNRTQTVEALKIIVPKLKELGYEFVTVSELLADGALLTTQNKATRKR